MAETCIRGPSRYLASASDFALRIPKLTLESACKHNKRFATPVTATYPSLKNKRKKILRKE